MPPAPVTLAPVEQKELVEWEEFTGRVEAVETVELRPRVAGYITQVHFQAGALVKKGDVLPAWLAPGGGLAVRLHAGK